MERLLKKITTWDKYKELIHTMFDFEMDPEIEHDLRYANDSDLHTKKYKNGNTLLMALAIDNVGEIGNDYENVIKKIAEKNPEIINARNDRGHSALIFAIIYNTLNISRTDLDTSIVRSLINYGSEVSDAKKLIEEFLLPILKPLKPSGMILFRLEKILTHVRSRNKARQLKFSPKAKTKILRRLELNPQHSYIYRGGLEQNEDKIDEEMPTIENGENWGDSVLGYYDWRKPQDIEENDNEGDYMGNEVAKKNTEEGNSKIMKKIIRTRDKNSKYNKEEAGRIWNEILKKALDD